METVKADPGIEGDPSGAERRRHRRLAIRLPVECCRKGQEGVLRAVTANISTGGVYFETELMNGNCQTLEGCSPEGDDLLELELTIPPGEGHFPYERRVRSVLRVVRREEIPVDGGGGSHGRVGVAGCFREPLKFGF